MEPFSSTPIFYFSVEETWDGISETSLVSGGQLIPVDLTSTELEEGCDIHGYIGLQNFGDVQK